jgi:cytidylate kinase
MQDFMNKLIEKAVANSVSNKVAKLKIKSEWHPDIVISRDPGSGGHPIAKKLAKKLGWKLLDEALMDQLADELGIPVNEFAKVDEHSRSWFSDTFHAIFNPDYVSDIRYITHLKKILFHASKKGDLVVLGRGANLILPQEKCLRVRVTASFATRVNNTYKFENKPSKAAATEWVSHIQKQRNGFIRQYFGSNPHNPWNYDLVISTDHITIDQAVDIILHAYSVKFPKEAKRVKSKVV